MDMNTFTNMNTFTKQAMEEASKITGKGFDDEETQNIGFKLACAAMAQELTKKEEEIKSIKETSNEYLKMYLND